MVIGWDELPRYCYAFADEEKYVGGTVSVGCWVEVRRRGTIERGCAMHCDVKQGRFAAINDAPLHRPFLVRASYPVS